MNQKQFVILVILAVVIGGLGFYFYGKQKESYTTSSFQPGQKVIEKFPLNDVAHLRIKQSTNEVNLVRGENNVWTVQERYNYPANYSEIGDFLIKMQQLKPVQSVEVGASQYGRLDLLAPDKPSTNTAILVEFKDSKNSTLKSLLLGKKYSKESAPGPLGGGGEFPVGRYVLVPENPPKVWLVNETFASIETKPEQWLSKDFFKVEKPKSVSVNYPAETNSWSLSRETENGEWKMADLKAGENFEASKASSLNYALSSPSFNDVANPNASPEQTGLAKATVAKIQTFDGFTYTINVGSKTNDDNYILKVAVQGQFAKERAPGKDEKPEDKQKLDKEFKDKIDKLQEKLKNEQKFEKWTYLVSKWTIDSVLKDRKDFFAEKKEEKKDEKKDKAGETATPPIDGLPPELKGIPTPPQPQAEKKEESKAQPAETKPEAKAETKAETKPADSPDKPK
jgi:hypothetical protein